VTGPGGAFVQGAPRRTRGDSSVHLFLSEQLDPELDCSITAAGPRGSRGPRKDKAAEGGEAAAPAEAAKA
jgi:hypothetical protein